MTGFALLQLTFVSEPCAYVWYHGLSQQGAWVPFSTPKHLKRTPQDTPKILCGISKNLNLKLLIEFFHLFIIPITLFNDIMPYFDEFIHVYGWNMSILWSPLKIWTPKNFTTANFRHPVSKSWLRHSVVPLMAFVLIIAPRYEPGQFVYTTWLKGLEFVVIVTVFSCETEYDILSVWRGWQRMRVVCRGTITWAVWPWLW